MSDETEVGRKFNEAVQSTAVIGGLSQKVTDIDARTERMDQKLDHVVSTIDRWGGAIVVVGAMVSAAVSIVVGLIVHAATGVPPTPPTH